MQHFWIVQVLLLSPTAFHQMGIQAFPFLLGSPVSRTESGYDIWHGLSAITHSDHCPDHIMINTINGLSKS